MPFLAKNKRAFFDYEIQEKYEAGVVLTGAEVKSVKAGHVNLKGSFAALSAGRPLLINCHIAPYKMAKGSQKNYSPTHTRKLLLTKAEIKSLIGKVSQKGLTLLPLSIYTKKGFVKVELGLGRGRKTKDKREILRKKTIEREIKQALRGKTNPIKIKGM